MMQVTGIRIERGQQVLVDGLDFSVAAGNALMLRGPNGSGKSTLLRALLGLTPVQAGQIQWQDDRLGEWERCASTSNRNFEGRQGRNGRTHLVSPAMAAAAGMFGKFVDIRDVTLN